jgi:predicted Zn-dependent protease
MVEAKVSLSYICLQRRDFQGAKDLLDSALRFDPGNTGALINLADLNMRLGHTREAMKICHVVMTREKHNPQACCLLAQGRIRLGKPQEALSLVKESILRTETTDTFCRMVMAEAFIAQGKTQEAIQILKELSDCEIPSHDVLLNLAHAQMMRHDWDGAWLTLDRAANLNHLNPWIWIYRSQIALARNDERWAGNLLYRAVSLNNQDSRSFAEEANLALRLGNYSQAVDLASKAILIEPVTPQAITVLEAAAKGL